MCMFLKSQVNRREWMSVIFFSSNNVPLSGTSQDFYLKTSSGSVSKFKSLASGFLFPLRIPCSCMNLFAQIIKIDN